MSAISSRLRQSPRITSLKPRTARSRRTWGRIASVQKVYPDTAINDDHAAPRPARLRAKLPRQWYLPKAASMLRCCRSLIINRSASSLHGLFLGCVPGNLLRFPHEGIIDFDVGAQGPLSDTCVSVQDMGKLGKQEKMTRCPVAEIMLVMPLSSPSLAAFGPAAFSCAPGLPMTSMNGPRPSSRTDARACRRAWSPARNVVASRPLAAGKTPWLAWMSVRKSPLFYAENRGNSVNAFSRSMWRIRSSGRWADARPRLAAAMLR